jgi:hypothetical protein
MRHRTGVLVRRVPGKSSLPAGRREAFRAIAQHQQLGGNPGFN